MTSAKAKDRDWLIPFTVVTAAQFGLWCAMWGLGYAGAPLVGLYNVVEIIGLGIALVPFALLYLWRIHGEGEQQPLARIRCDLDGSRIAAIGAAVILGAVSAGAFSALKAAVPLAVPFYLDPSLAGFERAVFGTDPWRISHSLLGWATPLIDRFYLSWLPVMLVAFNLVLLSKPSREKTRSLVAYVLMWPAVGTLGSYLMSSAGPIFLDVLYGGHSGLVAALQGEGAKGTLKAYDYLWTAYTNRFDALGGGISAMPSMHIAMACWLALTMRSVAPRWQWAGWAYLAMIWFSSVHLGWHYFSDGVVGIAGAMLVWRVAGGWRHVKSAGSSQLETVAARS